MKSVKLLEKNTRIVVERYSKIINEIKENKVIPSANIINLLDLKI